jgi:homotetrameric cytidine deaminase
MDEQAQLLAAARQARARAYAPYSGFAVGAAVRTRDGRIIGGANVENASYGLTLCAERAALTRALQEGCRPGEIVAVAVATEAALPTAPCGACRQWLHELAPEATVVCAGGPQAGPPLVTRVADLLPHAFGPRDLGLPPA